MKNSSEKKIWVVKEWLPNGTLTDKIVNWFDNEHSALACAEKLNENFERYGFFYAIRGIVQDEVEMPHYIPEIDGKPVE